MERLPRRIKSTVYIPLIPTFSQRETARVPPSLEGEEVFEFLEIP
jgi:hypothetical protein